MRRYLAIIGPGLIVANAGNDAGGIFTYSNTGAKYGLNLLWTFLPILLALIVTQEMVARLGSVTGKGLMDLIRERLRARLPVGLPPELPTTVDPAAAAALADFCLALLNRNEFVYVN